MNRWWVGHEASLQAQREALAQAALEAPDDVALQAEVAAEVARVLHLYKISLIPFMVCARLRARRPGRGGVGLVRCGAPAGLAWRV